MSLHKNFDPGKSNSTLRADGLCGARLEARSGDVPMTFCAIMTAPGQSAIAVISLRGSEAGEIVLNCFEGVTKHRILPGQIRYGRWVGGSETGPTAESVVLVPLSNDHFEIHCHGGTAASSRIIDDLRECGATVVESEHLSLAAEDRLMREAHQILAQCLTARTAAIAMDQCRGAMSHWARRLLHDLERQPESTEVARREAAELLRWADFGTRLGRPIGIVLTGPPNVGKSSLLNAILGYERSITFNAEGTTRDVLHADTVIDGLPVRLSDTAGIRDSEEPVEVEGVARARIAADEADLLIVVSEPQSIARQAVTHSKQVEIAALSERVIHVLNKSDLRCDSDRGDRIDFATSAVTGEGVGELVAGIGRLLSRSIPPAGAAVPLTNRQTQLIRNIAAENTAEAIKADLRELLGNRSDRPS